MPVVLLAFLSAMLAVLPAADVIPGAASPNVAVARARPHNRLVVFLIDGLGARKAYQRGTMPGVQARLGMSAHGIALASFPTITPPGLRAVFSGHRSQPEPEFPGGLKAASESDSVMKRASAAGLRSVAVGQFNWEPLFHGHGGVIITVPYHGEVIRYGAKGHDYREAVSEYDAQVFAAAKPWTDAPAGKWDLLILHVFESDPIGHAIGTEDVAYDNHLRWVDAQISALSAKLLRQAPTAFLLVADHGMTKEGTHGGMTAAERQVPFIAWGSGIVPKRLPIRPLYDSAPTITALLGVEPPVESEGVPAVDAFSASPQQLAGIWRGVLEQRAGRWNAVSALLPWLKGDPASSARWAESLERSGKHEEAAKALQRAVAEIDRRLDDALPEKWFGRFLGVAWVLVLAAGFSLAWPPEGRAKTAMIVAGLAVLAAAAAPLERPGWWAPASGLAVASAAALLLASLAGGLKGRSVLGRAAWAAWLLGMAGLCWQEVFDLNLWAFCVLAVWLCERAVRRPSANVGIAAAALVLSALARDARARSGPLSGVRALLPAPPFYPPVPLLRLVSAAAVAALLWSLLRELRELRGKPGRRPWLEVSFGALAPAVALALPGGGVQAAWAVGAAAAATAGAFLFCGMDSRGRVLSLAAAGFFASLATPAQACALILAVSIGWAMEPDERDTPLVAGLVLLGLALWAFTISGGHLRHLAISVEEGHRALGDAWHPRALVALLVLKYVAGAGAALLPRIGGRPPRQVLGALPPLGALGTGYMTSIWWDRFMAGGNLKFTGQLSYVGLLSTVVVGWVILGLWAAARLGRKRAAVSADRG